MKVSDVPGVHCVRDPNSNAPPLSRLPKPALLPSAGLPGGLLLLPIAEHSGARLCAGRETSIRRVSRASRSTLFRTCVVVYLLAGGGFDRIDTFIGPASRLRLRPL